MIISEDKESRQKRLDDARLKRALDKLKKQSEGNKQEPTMTDLLKEMGFINNKKRDGYVV